MVFFEIKPKSMGKNYLLNNFVKECFVIIILFKDEKIYVDESEINGVKYFNLLAGLISKPRDNCILDVYKLPENVNINPDLIINIITTCPRNNE